MLYEVITGAYAGNRRRQVATHPPAVGDLRVRPPPGDRRGRTGLAGADVSGRSGRRHP